ncbi:F-box protein SKIP8 [Senna tora]|uniref:F-box protein SKIP8 n=1 Tax=Senna tora TaxID=362788 RepID=A0A834TTM4_9FABA|nr:F-box protein SKIP8 [Senna tora]
MALQGTSFSFNGLSSTTKEFNFSPGLFINTIGKLQHVSLPSVTKNKLVWSKSFGRFRRVERVKSEDPESMLSGESIALDEESLEEELQNAIAEENYAKAAKIRDTLKNLHKDIKTTLLGANSRFYESFRTGNLALMQALWAKKDEVCCVHPGVKGIYGYDDVIESWNFVWANYEFPLEIKLEEMKVHARGDMGYVTCIEFVKTKGGRWGGQFVTNVFERIDGESGGIGVYFAGAFPRNTPLFFELSSLAISSHMLFVSKALGFWELKRATEMKNASRKVGAIYLNKKLETLPHINGVGSPFSGEPCMPPGSMAVVLPKTSFSKHSRHPFVSRLLLSLSTPWLKFSRGISTTTAASSWLWMNFGGT